MILPTLEIEKKLWTKGYNFVCGIDEVGRGCFAGPVVTGAVIFPQNIKLPLGIADSKLLTSKKRISLAEEIKKMALAYSVGVIGLSEINKFGIGKATQMAFRQSIKSLKLIPDFLLIDAFYIKNIDRKRQQPIKSGDKICASISAASIIAKVYRDALMEELHLKFPVYNFFQNKGYGTKSHREAIKQYGLCELHRKSFNLDKFLSL